LQAVALWLALMLAGGTAMAQEQGQLFATEEAGYARLILSFPSRQDLPGYSMRVENGVLSLEFDEPVAVLLPDIGATMPNYLSVARLDPNGQGLRLALRSSFNFNRTEAGEKLFIDLMPANWQGPPPPLPQDVIDELAERARLAAIAAEQERKAAEASELNPRPVVRIGRNPTFLRLQFDWNVPTGANFVQEGDLGLLAFEWPVEVDLREFAASLPAEVLGMETEVTPDGAMVHLTLAEGVAPRFYVNSPTQQVLDIDLAGATLPAFDAAALVTEEPEHAEAHEGAPVAEAYPQTHASTITPFVSVLGSTVRVVFPFEQDTPAAVFRRGDTVWMIFDTLVGVGQPDHSAEFSALVRDFVVQAAGDTQVIRLDLSQDRLATLGSEGMAWVLSLGDIMLSPTEPIDLSRRRDEQGDFEVVADVARPGRVHDFRDPLVGDLLTVVTAFPPARGVVRSLDFVEFSALRSVHGLVIRPKAPDLSVTLENELAVLGTPGGLTVSALDGPRALAGAGDGPMRGGFIDLASMATPETSLYVVQSESLVTSAALAEGPLRDQARLDLAQYYLANQFAHEALGVLSVLDAELADPDLTKKLRLTQAAANTLAHRPADALAILTTPAIGQEVDALLWRTMARVDAYDYRGARQDAVAALQVADSYPEWLSNRFRLAAARAAVETNDPAMAETVLSEVASGGLTPEERSLHQLLSGRVAELRGRTEEAIDTYGQVIAADIRPTRAEAVLRTLRLLDGEGRLDLARGAATLSAEALLWRGDALEADMQALLADMYFRNANYREGLETVQHAISTFPESPPVIGLRDRAQGVFTELFLDGLADTLSPVEALALYYDFRALTPPGARGDEMIRNLARRLVRVDLLPQAAELLAYQLDNRLTGVARAQVATDLAVIYLADRKPQDALRVLGDTRLTGLPETMERQRRLLEARAMLDGGRDQLALDLVRDLSGRDVDLLRIDANWRARRYSQAGEMIETLYAADAAAGPLNQAARMGVIRAAVGFALSGDTLGLARLRSKFGEVLVTSPEWPMFDLVTGPLDITSVEFKGVAAQVANVEGINAFLASYRETYGSGGALAPLTASENAIGDVASVE
jgi:hypothetical protein